MDIFDGMASILKGSGVSLLPCQSIPLGSSEEIVKTSPEVEIGEDVYDEEVDPTEVIIEVIPPRHGNRSFLRRTYKTEAIREGVSSEEIDVTLLGRHVIMGVADGSLNSNQVEKAIKQGTRATNFLGDISMESLVNGMLLPDGVDARFAMIGSSMMSNVLKSNMRDIRTKITLRSSQTYREPKFESIELDVSNLNEQNNYMVKANGVFVEVDLRYLFDRVTFRPSAKFLNKVKQFLKAYFVIACRPRCMVWRYTLRRSGSSHKKAILNLPNSVMNSLLSILLDLTGIGSGQKSYNDLNPASQFFQSLGEDSRIREQRFSEMCQLKDPLANFFRETITDCLNEVREMPFCCKTGYIVGPLRGKTLDIFCVTWKEYEQHLKKEYENPSEANTKMRISFEQKVCEAMPSS